MKNREVFQKDPSKILLLNNGVAAMTDALTEEERRTLRFELEHFVCEGEYRRGLVRILDSYTTNMGQPEQPAAWISGFFGSGKSHLAKILRYLWTDYTFPEDGATARGLARLPDEVKEQLKEISTLGKRHGGLHAASGTLGAGAGDSVRLSLLGIIFRSVGLPESYPQAMFCMWLRKNDIYEQVCAEVEAAGRDFRKELNDLYVSPLIARALLKADPQFASDDREAKSALRAQFLKPKDITADDFVRDIQDAIAPQGQMPCTAVILDEVQQYIGDDTTRSFIVQDVVEACSKRFGSRLLFVGTGQTALSATPALQRLQGRFTVSVPLSDSDVETVTRRVVLAKRADKISDVEKVLNDNSGETDRHLKETRIGPRSEDKGILVEDYPLLPVRRRFWEYALRAVDKAGTTGQLRTQLRIVYDAVRKTADSPFGTVVPADFLFDEISANLLQTGVLLREIDEIIRKQDDGTEDGRLKARLCALVFFIRKLPREAAVDIGVRATPEMLADLLVEDLANDGTTLRVKIPQLLEELVAQGALMKVETEFSLQTKESSEWEQEYRSREAKVLNDLTRLAGRRAQLLSAECRKAISSVKLTHGQSKEPRKLLLHFGADPPVENKQEIPVWIRDEWGTEEKTVLADARAAGSDSPVISIFIARTQADALRKCIAELDAAQGTLDFKGVPTTREGIEARESMQTRQIEASRNLENLVKEIVGSAKVFQGGGSERLELSLKEKVEQAAGASLDRMFPSFKDGDEVSSKWSKAIQLARGGAENPLEAVDFKDKIERHPVCSAVLTHVGAGKKGRDIRSHFANSPYGWPRDAVDAALISLVASGHLSAVLNGVSLKPKQLDQSKIPVTDFRVETATIGAKDRIKLRGLFLLAGIQCKPNEETSAAGPFLSKLLDLANGAGGDPPLPERPKTDHMILLQSFAGTEQLVAILEKHDQLKENIDEWDKTKALLEKRLPVYKRLLEFLLHSRGKEFALSIQTQVDAIRNERRLLDSSDPLPDLLKAVVDGLRTTLAQAEVSYSETYDKEMGTLSETANWRKLGEAERKDILQATGLTRISTGPLGSDEDVLASLNRISPEGWATRTAALPQRFADARREADKRFEPKIQHIKLTSDTLKTPEDLESWLQETRKKLLGKLDSGPIVIV